MELDVRKRHGLSYAFVRFTAREPDGHRREVERAMDWILSQPDQQARVVFDGIQHQDIGAHLNFYRTKALEAKAKCGAFAFVGLQGVRSLLFNTVILFANMPMRMVASAAEAEEWVTQAPERAHSQAGRPAR